MIEPVGSVKRLSARRRDGTAQVLGQRPRPSPFTRLELEGPRGGVLKARTSEIRGAPICAGWASPLRVATGGNANWRFGVRSRRSPARANRRRDGASGVRKTPPAPRISACQQNLGDDRRTKNPVFTLNQTE
jgi:hypothetical protein